MLKKFIYLTTILLSISIQSAFSIDMDPIIQNEEREARVTYKQALEDVKQAGFAQHAATAAYQKATHVYLQSLNLPVDYTLTERQTHK